MTKIEIGWLALKNCSLLYYSILYKISRNELQVFEKYTIKKIQYIY